MQKTSKYMYHEIYYDITLTLIKAIKNSTTVAFRSLTTCFQLKCRPQFIVQPE